MKLFRFRSPLGPLLVPKTSNRKCHEMVRKVLQGCKGVAQIKDDVLIYGKDEEHDVRLKKVLEGGG